MRNVSAVLKQNVCILIELYKYQNEAASWSILGLSSVDRIDFFRDDVGGTIIYLSLHMYPREWSLSCAIDQCTFYDIYQRFQVSFKTWPSIDIGVCYTYVAASWSTQSILTQKPDFKKLSKHFLDVWVLKNLRSMYLISRRKTWEEILVIIIINISVVLIKIKQCLEIIKENDSSRYILDDWKLGTGKYLLPPLIRLVYQRKWK